MDKVNNLLTSTKHVKNTFYLYFKYVRIQNIN